MKIQSGRRDGKKISQGKPWQNEGEPTGWGFLPVGNEKVCKEE